MKTVENLTKEDRDVLKVPLEIATPHTAVMIRDLRQIDKICKLLEGDAEPLILEDADFDFLQDKINNYTGWSSSSEARKAIFSAVDKFRAKEAVGEG